MDNRTASITALATSLMRAAHTRRDPHPLIDDPWGDRLVPESVKRALAARDDLLDAALMGSLSYANVILRARYAEDALSTAVSKGCRQYVLIGAGFDSFSLRRPAYAANLQIFELDAPATQKLKIERIEACAVKLPDTVHFIAADLSQESVAAALGRSAFKADQLTFFTWLGVTMYLTREANLATFRSIARCSPPGSEMVFTYLDERAFQARSEAFRGLQQRVASLGEPFLSGFDPLELVQDLAACGLDLLEDLGGPEAAARYGRDAEQDLAPSVYSHIALARLK